MDRTNISIAATSISEEFNFSSVQLGFIFSAFGWTYVALQIPGGFFTDRFGPRILYALLFSLRLAIGALEAPAYPINNRVVTGWFPDNERASAIAVYTSGQYIGLAILTPVMATIQHYLNWRGLFIITGLVGIIWGLVWYLFYRDPSQSAANQAELDYIKNGGE